MWTPERPLKELGGVSCYYTDHAEYLYYDLLSHKLCISTRPHPEPKHHDHKLRIVLAENPAWYSQLYNSQNSFRRDRSIKSLDRLRKGEDLPFMMARSKKDLFSEKIRFRYDSVYRELIHDDLTKGYYCEGDFIQPNDEVRAYFNMPPLYVKVRKREKDNLEDLEPLPF